MNTESIIEKLNLKPLNVLNLADLKYEKTKDGNNRWTCETKIENTECLVEIFSHNANIQLYLLPDVVVEDTNAWLKKVNLVNSETLGLGACCYVNEDSNTLAIRTAMGDTELNSEEFVITLLNNSIAEMLIMLKSLLA